MVKLIHITTVPETLFFLEGQIGYMKSKGFVVHALSSPGELLNQFGRSEKLPLHPIAMTREITPCYDFLALFRVWKRIRKIGPEIVHAHTPKGGLVGMICSWMAKVPVRFYTIHGLPMMTAFGWRRQVLKWSEKISCLLADQVLCVSHSIREVVIKENICSPEKIKVLAHGSVNGVDATGHFNPEHFSAQQKKIIREQYGVSEDAIVIGFIGRMVRDKGLKELADVWRVLRDDFPKLQLLLVGPFEPQNPLPKEIERLFRQDPRICLTGRVRDTAPLFAIMDLFVFLSYREGFGLVLIEAAAMNLPVVASRIPGCVDAVQDGVTGTLVALYDTINLTFAIRNYLSNQQLRREHGSAGRKRALRCFKQGKIWNELYTEYIKWLYLKNLPSHFFKT